MRAIAAVAAAFLATVPGDAAAPAPAGIVVDVGGISLPRGVLYLSLCRRPEFATMRCALGLRRRITRPGPMRLRFDKVAPGAYAILAMQDVNGNRRLDRDPWGAPSEPTAISGRPSTAPRLPSFDQSAFRHAASITRVTLELQ